MLLIAVVAAFVFAHQHLDGPSASKSHSGTQIATPQSTPTILPQPTDTPTPPPAPNHTTAANSSTATIRLCGTIASRFQERVGICGSHFHAGDKLELWVYVAGSQPRPYRALVVNAQGQFQTFLVITQCRETITAMYVKDLTNKSINPAALSNIQVGRCVSSPAG